MRIPKWLSFFVFVFPLAVLPLLFGDFVIHGLTRLHLRPEWALVLVFGMLVTGFVNIPIALVPRDRKVANHPLAVIGLSHLWPQLRRVRQETVIAVNVGGCLIPAGLALYEAWHLASTGQEAILGGTSAVIINTIVCYLIARPEPHLGITVPGLIPPIAAAGLAWVLTPDQAPPVALVAGVVGPLVGADLLHLKDLEKTEVGVVSIGGAGTFDGIVLSGVIAAYLT